MCPKMDPNVALGVVMSNQFEVFQQRQTKLDKHVLIAEALATFIDSKWYPTIEHIPSNSRSHSSPVQKAQAYHMFAALAYCSVQINELQQAGDDQSLHGMLRLRNTCSDTRKIIPGRLKDKIATHFCFNKTPGPTTADSDTPTTVAPSALEQSLTDQVKVLRAVEDQQEDEKEAQIKAKAKLCLATTSQLRIPYLVRFRTHTHLHTHTHTPAHTHTWYYINSLHIFTHMHACMHACRFVRHTTRTQRSTRSTV